MPTDAFEIIGIAAGDADQASVQIPEDMRRRSRPAPGSLADAAKAALGITLSIITGEIGQKRLTIQGLSRRVEGRPRRVLDRLPRRAGSDKQQVVLKILNATAGLDEILLQRFVQEFDIISSIDHPNVVKIYDRGFSDRHAYIAMEYFPNGSLAEVIAQRLEWPTGLVAACPGCERAARGPQPRRHTPRYQAGKSHGARRRQHRPRDFGIAKRLGEDKGARCKASSTGPLLRFAGADRRQPRDDAVPISTLLDSFLRDVDAPTPFDAESVSGLIALHVSAPRPKLPDEFAEYQGLLDRMIAVDPRNASKGPTRCLRRSTTYGRSRPCGR